MRAARVAPAEVSPARSGGAASEAACSVAKVTRSAELPKDRRPSPPRSSGTASATSTRTTRVTATTAGVPLTAPTVTPARLRRPRPGDLGSGTVTPQQAAVPPTGSPEGADPAAHIAVLPGVADAVERARRAVDDLRGHRVLRRSADRVAAESALRGARASAALAGADVPLETCAPPSRRRTPAMMTSGHARRGRSSSPTASGWRTSTRVVVQGALRVAAEIGLLRNAWPKAPLQVVARLHTLAAAGSVPDDVAGPPRARGGRPGSAASASCSRHRPPHRRWSSRPSCTASWRRWARSRSAPASSAAAAGRLTMVGRGLDPTAVSVPEVGHVELGREAYLDALDGYRARAAPTASRRGWCTAPRRSCSVPARASPSASRSSAAPDRNTVGAQQERRPRGDAAGARQTGLPGVHHSSGDQD